MDRVEKGSTESALQQRLIFKNLDSDHQDRLIFCLHLAVNLDDAIKNAAGYFRGLSQENIIANYGH